MSIVTLNKATVYARASQLTTVLRRLQGLGFLHLIPLAKGEEIAAEKSAVTPEAKEALTFLLQAPHKRNQLHNDRRFKADHVKSKALHLKARLKALKEERDRLKQRIAQLRPWGDFTLPPLEALQGYRLWFYTVPHHRMSELSGCGAIWQQVGRDHRFAYVVAISADEPDSVPFDRTHAGTKSLSSYLSALETVENEIEDKEAERIAQTRWLDLYINSLDRLLDREALEQARREAYADSDVMAVQGWIPQAQAEALRTFCAEHGCALVLEAPRAEESPPTLLHNPAALSAGEDLLGFYMMPGYRQNDPSTLFFFSFALFFGMILGDAGYGALCAAATYALWRTMGRSPAGRRMRILLAALSATTLVWGVLIGSYFGLAPEPGSLMAFFHVMNVSDYDTMMALSIGIGGLHVILANLAVARQHFAAGTPEGMLAPAGWVLTVAGALWAYYMPQTHTAGFVAAGIGLLMVAAFTGSGQRGMRRIGSGLIGLTRITSAFGDILSYLRLFALGLATSSMAIAFNDLAAQVAAQFAGVGLLLALIVLLIGHTLNLALGIVSGVVHGLRLNVIEYLNWGVPEEGYAFKPFRKKEKKRWNL